MDTFSSDDVDIAYQVAGEGIPLVLLHGFAGHSADNWVRTGWVGALQKTGRQVIVMDARGHGESAKLYEPSQYGVEKTCGDLASLLDHLELESAEFTGFSMGGMTTLNFAHRHPDRVRQFAILGVGDAIFDERAQSDDMGQALEADKLSGIKSDRAKQFRLYAEALKQDKKALAAASRAPRSSALTWEALQTIAHPAAFVVGQRDDLAGGLSKLQEAIPQAHMLTIPGLDHPQTLSHGMAKAHVIDFLTGHLDLPGSGGGGW